MVPDQEVWTDRYPAKLPDGRRLVLPLRDLGDVAVAGFIANQASFAVLDQIAAWTADAARHFRADIVVGLPTLGHTIGAAMARALGHANWVAPSTTRKRWYDDALSAPLGSITAPAAGLNANRRKWLDPRLLPRLQGQRVLLVGRRDQHGQLRISRPSAAAISGDRTGRLLGRHGSGGGMAGGVASAARGDVCLPDPKVRADGRRLATERSLSRHWFRSL